MVWAQDWPYLAILRRPEDSTHMWADSSVGLGGGQEVFLSIGHYVKLIRGPRFISGWAQFFAYYLLYWRNIWSKKTSKSTSWLSALLFLRFEATDRWPLSLQSAIVTSFFGRPVGECVHTILSNALFDVPFLKSVKAISFRAGQPLGYYASWPLFTLTHHLVVMYCASKVIARETQT